MGTPFRSVGRGPIRVIGCGLIAITLAACSASGATPSGAPSTEPTASPTASSMAAPASAAPAATVPGGTWTGIRWTAAASQDPVFEPAPDQTDPNAMDYGWEIQTWSGGYIAFDTVTTNPSPGSWTSTTSTRHSADGLHWTTGGTFALSGNSGSDPGDLSGGALVEANGVLLAVAGQILVCGSVADELTPVAVSSDGTTWTKVAPNLGSIQWLKGGASGFIATGQAGVFISKNGTTWARASLSGSAFKGLDAVDSGASLADGFVISGETLGPQQEGCAGIPTPLSPSLWFSPDGATWTRDALSGGLTGDGLYVDVCAATDKVAVATEYSGDTRVSWTSTDGKTWQAVPSGSPVSCDWAGDVSRVGDRYLHIGQNDDGTTTISVVGDDLSMTTLPQAGDIPAWDSMYGPFVGPNGVLATDQQGHVHLGVPAGS
jgi:hypothetical protein